MNKCAGQYPINNFNFTFCFLNVSGSTIDHMYVLSRIIRITILFDSNIGFLSLKRRFDVSYIVTFSKLFQWRAMDIWYTQ